MNLHFPKKLVIGLTGSILSGKSTALGYFKKYGAGVLSADEICHRLYQQPRIQAELNKRFGSCEPAELSAKVFRDSSFRKKLESFLHPLIWRYAADVIRQDSSPIVFFEVPLLFESDWDKKVDISLFIQADCKTLSARLKGRKMTRAEYLRRLRTQMPEKEKFLRADITVFHKSKKELANKIQHLYQAFCAVSEQL